MDLQLVNNLSEILMTMRTALDYLATKQEDELEKEFLNSRTFITACMETKLKRPINQWIEADLLSHHDWLLEAEHVLDDIKNPIQINNQYDKAFLLLLEYIWKTTPEEMVNYLKKRVQDIMTKSEHLSYAIPNYFSTYHFWGTLNPKNNDYTTLEQRVHILKQRSFDFLWLYKRLEDYTSKRTLYAILANWALFDTETTKEIKSSYKEYFEPDIFENNRDDVFVDVGAYVGDSIGNYIQMYGERYKKIFAYEISPDTCRQLSENTKNLHNIIICQKGVGKEHDNMRIEANVNSSANKVASLENEQVAMGDRVEIVPLDEDIKEPVTFIKMDIEGAEQDALLGCRNIISEQHPKLAICVYHGYDDLWRLPQLINEMHPNYKFYLRHYGENILPTEFVLLCKDK